MACRVHGTTSRLQARPWLRPTAVQPCTSPRPTPLLELLAPASDRERNWANGICHWRWKTDKIIFNPGLKTVYSNDTSVLTSDITLQATCDLNYYGYVVWSNLTGNSKLSDEELCQLSNEMFDNYTLGRYDDRFRIIPNTHLTKEDEINGWSWLCAVS